MDFLAFLPYIGILILIILNALLVLKRKITVDDSDHTPGH